MDNDRTPAKVRMSDGLAATYDGGNKGFPMRSMSDFENRFRRSSRIFWFAVHVVLALIVCYFIAVGVLAYTAISMAGGQDFSAGIRPVIERIWCGKPGCLGG